MTPLGAIALYGAMLCVTAALLDLIRRRDV